MDCVAGKVFLPKGTAGTDLDASTGLYEGVAYASQLPWLQHASIKNVGLVVDLRLSSRRSFAVLLIRRTFCLARHSKQTGMPPWSKRARSRRISRCLRLETRLVRCPTFDCGIEKLADFADALVQRLERRESRFQEDRRLASRLLALSTHERRRSCSTTRCRPSTLTR
jgi:hypothetical protein